MSQMVQYNLTDGRANINVHLMDCMDFMKDLPDNAYDLAIVDPWYELPAGSSRGKGKLKKRAFNNGCISTRDKAPDAQYFKILFRVSKNQIIWGGNYFNLPPTRCVIAWDKVQPWENFSQVEIAWTSFTFPSKLYRLDNRTGNKIHPTQKPVDLYKWLLKNYAKEDDKILDTHMGSGSIAIACWDMGFDLDTCEIDSDYFDAATRRIENHRRQLQMF